MRQSGVGLFCAFFFRAFFFNCTFVRTMVMVSFNKNIKIIIYINRKTNYLFYMYNIDVVARWRVCTLLTGWLAWVSA